MAICWPFTVSRPVIRRRSWPIAWGFSTSGNSKNVIRGIESANSLGLQTLGMTGRGGILAECAGLVYTVASDVTARIQETHITIAHILCDLVDRILFPEQYPQNEKNV